jgi:hypothetical protein
MLPSVVTVVTAGGLVTVTCTVPDVALPTSTPAAVKYCA